MSTRIAHIRKGVQTWAVLAAMSFALAACGGGGGSGIGADGPPAAPTAGYIPGSSTNPQNVVNQSNQSNLWVHVEFGPESTSNATVTVTIGDAATGVFATAQAAASEGQGATKVGPMDVRSMPDGSYPIIAEVTAPGGSSGEISLGSVLKDTTFYSSAVAASVAALPGGARPNGTAMSNVINLVNVGGVTVTTVWGADADDSLSFVVDLTDEQGNRVTSGVFAAPEGAGNVDATNIDASGLDEGSVTVTVHVTDTGGNQTAFAGTAATKDVTVPLPLTVQVPQGGSNPADFINAASQTSVTVRAILGSDFTTQETISIELTDGTNTVTAGPLPVLAPESPNTHEMNFTDMDVSSFADGLITLSAFIHDANGNRVSFPGVWALKDTIIGQATVTLVAQGVNNPPGIINLASEGQVYVDVACDSQTAQGDAVTAHFETAGIQAHSAPVPATGPGEVPVGPTAVQMLYDGNVTVWATITDAAGNSWTGATSVADKGTVAPTMPAFVRVAGNSTNGVDVVNSFNVSSTTVQTQVGSGNDASRTITFLATDDTGSVTQTTSAPTGGTAISFNGLDFAALQEGSFVLQCWATDGFANRSEIVGATPFKDTVAPAPANSVVVVSSTSNPQGFINASSAAASVVAVDFPTPYEEGVYWQVVFTDSVSGSVNSPTFKSILVGGPQSFTINLSSLADGPISVAWNASDTAGNPTSHTSPNATKDTMASGSPSSVGIAAGPANPVNVINESSEIGVHVQASFPSGALGGGEQYTVTLTPKGMSSPSVTYGPIAGAAAGGSTFTFGPMNSTVIPEGGVDVSIQVSDPAGNAVTFGGTGGTKDTTAPAAATTAGVSAGTMNMANFINFHNEPSIDVGVGFGPGSMNTDQVWVMLTGGAFNVMAGPLTAPNGTGALSFTGMNGSLLADGSVSVQITIEDENGNQSVFVGTQAQKDTIAPSAPTSASVAAGILNAADFINMTNLGNVVVAVELPSDYKGTEQVTVTLTGSATASAAVLSPIYGGSILVSQIDASALADGPLTVSVDVVDPAGNSVNFSGTPCSKDTTPPEVPTSISIPASAANPANVINSQTATSVDVVVTYDSSMTGAETAILHLTDASGDVPVTVSVSPVAVPVGGGMATFSALNAGRLADGAISLTLEITDAQGNGATFTGTSATKDTVGPSAPLTAHVWATSVNPTNFINGVSASGTRVDVSFDTGSEATDTVTVTLGGAVNSGPMSAPLGAGVLNFNGIDASSLADGSALVQVSVLDASMNLTTMFGTTALKDTILPDPYTSAHIVAGSSNAQDIVNTSNVGSALMIFNLPSTYAGSEIIDVSITDTTLMTVSVTGLIAPFTGGNRTVHWPDLSAMADGTLTVSFTATDPAGNQGVFAMGTNPTKDTTPPVGPSALGIPMGATNPIDFINGQTATAVSCAVMYETSMVGTEVATLVYTGMGLSGDAAIERRFGPFAVPASGGAATISGANLSAFADGTISISIEIVDVAGNIGVYAGTSATKDTVVPNDAVVDPMPTPVNVTGQNVTGVSDPDNTVEVIVSGTPVATATSDALGSFIINWTVPAGVMTLFEIRATDTAGNPQTLDTAMDWNGSALSVTHDATAPSIPWTDNTLTANLGDNGSVSGGSFVDVDSDGDLDLFVSGTNRLWRNDGAGVYTDVTATAVPGGFVGNESATWGDYDGDGDLDLWTTHSVSGSTLWQNDGAGNFTDVTATATASVSGVLKGASWLDYNADGWVDLFTADTDMSGHELLSNNGLSAFSPVSGNPLGTGVSAPRWVCVGDLDGNGAMDVVIGDAAPSFQYMNDGSGMFTDMAGVGQSGFSADTSTSNGGITMADLDNDGDLDMFVASGGAGGTNQFWQNDGAGNFTDVAAIAGCDTAANAYDVVIADFDNDGLRDIYLACNGTNILYRNQGDQVAPFGIPEFTDVASEVGGIVNDGSDGRLCCAGDVDGDGDMDVFVGNEAVPNVMYQNDLGNNFRYLMVKLVGKSAAMGGSSPDAIGAQVRIEDAATGNSIMWHWVGSGRGAGADDPKTLHFGGITPSRAYHVHVTWPAGGATQALMNVVPTATASQTVTIVEQ